MKKLTQCAAALLIGTLLSASAGAAEKTLVTVNGSAIPQSTADLFIAEQTAQGATDNAELRNAVREELIRRAEAEIAMAEAELRLLEREMNDPAQQSDPAKSAAIAAAYAAKEREIEQRYEKWGALSDEG